ncbi:MAG: hypothetical protein IPI66_11800 [Chitinophagaceae bacterium]|nr:hypothetical protein [Chitinophagaceae bacterium]MBL0056168.1 hypothetical protein [Chitinophagaceae bacterium]
MRKVRLLFLTAGIFFSLASISQSVTPSILNVTGGTNMYTFYRFEWSFGEAIAIETMSVPGSNIVTNGVLQPGTHNPATVNNTGGWDPDEIKVLPNPTRDMLEIDIFTKHLGWMTINLFDAAGTFYGRKEFAYTNPGRIEKWSFGAYASGTYFLDIQLRPAIGTSVLKKGTFKVIKIR